MSQESGFFNAKVIEGEFDRVYLAETFARYFSSFIGNGVFAGISSSLQVTQMNTADFAVLVQMGQAWINGYWFALDGEPYAMSIALPDGVMPRIDSVVVSYSTVGRDITLKIKTGTPAITPTAPPLQRDADAYELQLATVYVRAGSLNIQQQDITDTRPISEVCGWVHGVIDQIDTTTLGLQLQTFIDEYKAQFNADYEEFLLWLADLRALALQAYNEFLVYLASLRTAADSELATFISYLLSLHASAQLSHDEFIDFLQMLRIDSTDRVQQLLYELEALVSGEPIGDLLLRIIKLEELQPTEELATIEHTLNKYVSCNLYELEHGAGIGGAGIGGAGGSELTSSQSSYDLYEKHRVVIRGRIGLGIVESVLQLNSTQWVINFTNSDRSVLVIFDEHEAGVPIDVLDKINLLEAMILNTFEDNQAEILFDTLDDVDITGAWNAERQHLYT
jgi:hypothetical protein